MGARGHGAARSVSPSPAGRGHPWVLQRPYKPRNARTGGSQPGPLLLFSTEGCVAGGRVRWMRRGQVPSAAASGAD